MAIIGNIPYFQTNPSGFWMVLEVLDLVNWTDQVETGLVDVCNFGHLWALMGCVKCVSWHLF